MTSYETLPAVDVPFISGGRSSTVAALQDLLRVRGFYPDPPDGIIGPRTQYGVEWAFVSLGRSQSQEVRDLVQAGPSGLTAGRILSVLASAFRADDAYKAVRSEGGTPGSSSMPSAPDEEIAFTPADMAALKGGRPWWHYALGLGAVGAVGYGLYRSAKR